MKSISPLLHSVARKITPSSSELRAEQEMFKKIKAKILKSKGPHVGVVLAGSIARNTHLRGDHDLDIFVFYPVSLAREKFEKAGLFLAHSIFGKNVHEEAYSEHPYVRGIIDGFDVEIVPTYQVKKAIEKLSAVDRTPFHAEYMRTHLSETQQRDVRLLKQFLKGIEVYGADVKMQGVPGYLVEILVLQYGSFVSVLENMANWRSPVVIDQAKQYENPSMVKSLFPNAFLVIVDPTDKTRNVAGALSQNQFSRMIAAARSFLKNPREKFFFAHEEKGISLSAIRSHLKKEDFVGIKFPYPKGMVEDVAWGQFQRIGKKLVHVIEEHDFCIRRHVVWTDGEKECVLVLDVENPVLQPTELRMGPPITDRSSCDRFLSSHKNPVSGPRIENGRLVVIEKRKISTVQQALTVEWKKIAQTEGKEIKPFLNKGLLLSENALVSLSKKQKGFAREFGNFLKGKDWFL